MCWLFGVWNPRDRGNLYQTGTINKRPVLHKEKLQVHSRIADPSNVALIAIPVLEAAKWI
jgi:hypothetical protein